MVKKFRTEVCLWAGDVNWLGEDRKEFFDRDVDSKDVSICQNYTAYICVF